MQKNSMGHMSSYTDRPFGALMLDEPEFYDEVIKELTQFINAGSKTGAAVHNRALAYWETGQIDKALSDFNAAIAQLPSSHMPAQIKGMMLHNLDRIPEALAMLDLAVSIAPNEATVLRTRAGIRVAAGRVEDAIADLECAIQLEPTFEFTIAERDRLKAVLKVQEQARQTR
jgi:tetratricopeptide (TPR) repeat protein